ncbi:uncharacterized protein [Euwallacea fornicatus]|uniref:uncharacterized protein n=1 Tax=Euwallacea fornicatus TaxID=995702 RepID=UPI00338FE018
MDHINVCVRISPNLNNNANSCLQIISKEPAILLIPERSQLYHFDHIFSKESNQTVVYNDAVKPFVDYIKQGFNCTVFAYGQTGTGKTYTMGSGLQKLSNSSDSGIIPRALEQIFEERYEKSEAEIEVFVSFCEIYNEKVFDLLQGNKSPLSVCGFIIQGLSVKHVASVVEAKELLELGNKNRHIGETKQNANSSRSHAIFTVYFSLKDKFKEINAKLNLVDLAGSESVRKTGSQGSTFQEGININKGLLSIGQVISALLSKSKHIPYRQSMITSILQGSLNIDNYISLIACVSGDPKDLTETVQTLDFANRAKGIKCNPEVKLIIDKYRMENPSSFSSGRTPVKRSTSTSKTPAAKKMALASLPTINESHTSSVDSLSQISTMSSASATSVGDLTQQALSPVIRKYMTKMEASLMIHLETVVKNTLKRPTRSSLHTGGVSASFNQENTPNIHWSKIQNEVSRMVQSEIAQFTIKGSRAIAATSSPIEREKLSIRRLEYSSPGDVLTENIEPVFKIPRQPPEKKKPSRKTKFSVSPIDMEIAQVIPRRSMRLSLKNASAVELDSSALSDVVSFDSNSLKNRDNPEVKYSIELNKILNNSANNNHFDLDMQNTFEFDSTKRKQSQSYAFRRSMRLLQRNSDHGNTEQSVCTDHANKQKKVGGRGKKVVKATDKYSPTKKRRRFDDSVEQGINVNDSPYTAHSKRVLKTLNKGSQRDIEKLHSIGPKTAEQILLFRTLKGNFSQIPDIAALPGWGPNKYKKFVVSNFLKKD